MADEEEVPTGPKPKKVLVVLSSAEEGYDAASVAAAYATFTQNAWLVDFASVAGTAVADPASVEAGSAAAALLEDEEKKALLEAPTKVAEVPLETATADYEAILFAGGYGALVDLPECAEAAALIKAFVEAEKVVATVGQGSIVLAGVVLGDETKVRTPLPALCVARGRASATL